MRDGPSCGVTTFGVFFASTFRSKGPGRDVLERLSASFLLLLEETFVPSLLVPPRRIPPFFETGVAFVQAALCFLRGSLLTFGFDLLASQAGFVRCASGVGVCSLTGLENPACGLSGGGPLVLKPPPFTKKGLRTVVSCLEVALFWLWVAVAVVRSLEGESFATGLVSVLVREVACSEARALSEDRGWSVGIDGNGLLRSEVVVDLLMTLAASCLASFACFAATPSHAFASFRILGSRARSGEFRTASCLDERWVGSGGNGLRGAGLGGGDLHFVLDALVLGAFVLATCEFDFAKSMGKFDGAVERCSTKCRKLPSIHEIKLCLHKNCKTGKSQN